MFTTLKQLAEGSLLLLEVKGLRTEVAGLRAALQAIAGSLARLAPAPLADPPSGSELEVTYVSDAYQAEVMDIELRLTRALGMPPTEEEVLAEWERRHEQAGAEG